MAPDDLGGILAMVPAFSTAGAGDYDAVDTVDVDNLGRAVKAVIDDGVGALATTGSFGEFHTLTEEEWAVLVKATVDAAGGQVPVFAGCTDVNPRSAIRRARSAADLGADGVLVGIPFYFPSTVENAVEFIERVGEAIPDRAVMLYHNPVLHKIEIPPDAVTAMVERVPNLIAAKDGNRDSRGFLEVVELPPRRLRIFCAPWQYHAYQGLGAAGFWSYDVWMGPAPHRALLRAVDGGDTGLAARLTMELHGSAGRPTDLRWRETLAKLAIAQAGYCDPGPLRPPFVHIPDEVRAKATAKANKWLAVAEWVEAEAVSPE